MADGPETAVAKDDLALVAEAKAGNYEAFEELVNRYEHKIYRLGMNITGNAADAEDVLQEAFLKAFTHLGEFRADSRFYTWLVRIAVNEALMKLRKIRSDRTVPIEDETGEDGDPIPRELADWKPNPEQIYAQAQIESILREAAQKLPATYRAVFLLRDVEDLSTAETASVLGLTEGTVKARLFRARMMLREELSKVFKRG
jgi:RNA polymerase sigma-70 factor (ECF subfamily)